MSHEPMHRIIRLKRYEQPPEGYFDDFLREFHRRQRAELLRPSLGGLFLERLQELMSEIRVPAMAYAGATAVAVAATILILNQPRPSTPARTFTASYRQQPVDIPAIQPVSFRIDPQANDRFDSLFPPSSLLRPRPANHESPLRF
jgi:hypothetical protein